MNLLYHSLEVCLDRWLMGFMGRLQIFNYMKSQRIRTWGLTAIWHSEDVAFRTLLPKAVAILCPLAYHSPYLLDFFPRFDTI